MMTSPPSPPMCWLTPPAEYLDNVNDETCDMILTRITVLADAIKTRYNIANVREQGWRDEHAWGCCVDFSTLHGVD